MNQEKKIDKTFEKNKTIFLAIILVVTAILIIRIFNYKTFSHIILGPTDMYKLSVLLSGFTSITTCIAVFWYGEKIAMKKKWITVLALCSLFIPYFEAIAGLVILNQEEKFEEMKHY